MKFVELFITLSCTKNCNLLCISVMCFVGIEKGSVVAVSTYMASEHGNRQDQKEWFMVGYNEMLRRIEPEKIICYNTPFPEMEGNTIEPHYLKVEAIWQKMQMHACNMAKSLLY